MLLPVLESGEETLVGGQAVLEGVMMRAPHSYCVAVRKQSGVLVTEEMPLDRISDQYKIFKYPILRGCGTLFQAMKLGIKSLQFSARAAMEDLVPEGQAPPKELPKWVMIANLVAMLGSFLFLYKFLPLYLATKLGSVVPALSSTLGVNITDGTIRILIFLVFMAGISRMKDIRRVFEYHGAEHKVVFNFESGKPVNVPTAQSFQTWHPRCGTSFMMLLMLVSFVVYMFIPVQGFLAKFLLRIALLPVITGVCYEMIRFAARRPGSILTMLTAPGMWLQRITTKQPTDAQAEVAIHALEGAMALEKSQGGELVIA
ncbi:MAG TPA: DUF1385 domain-containing protein [Candidatus Limnocylindrales bacterium]|nr:DUF1385 domain-containing protein [Candidatus Limnocylindrales bacterium]